MEYYLKFTNNNFEISIQIKIYQSVKQFVVKYANQILH